ncbi:hypothetical protein V1527DRAFT_405475 [Lipomyces starkeyi]
MSSSEGTSLYAPGYATFGDYPLKKDDIPGSILFIVIFALLGVVNLVIYWSNIARGHKFVPSTALVIHCIARTVTFAMRLAYTYNPTNTGIAIASDVLLAAGVIILFVQNINFSQQIFTSRHPSRAYVGSAYYRLMRLYQTSITGVLVAFIVMMSEYYHVSASTQKGFVTFRKVAMIYFVLVAFTPLLTLTAAYAISQSHKDKTWPTLYAYWIERYSGTYRPDSRRESEVAQFYAQIALGNTRKPVHVIPPTERGARSKSLVLIVLATLILTFTTAVRATSIFEVATLNDKPWYDYRATMYMCVGFAEALIVIVWTIGRVDLIFYIPDQKWDGSVGTAFVAANTKYGFWRTN